MSRKPKEDDPEGHGLRFDLATVLLVLIVALLLLFVTAELWMPHPFTE